MRRPPAPFAPIAPSLVLALAPALVLTACAAAKDYPSLERRTVERASGTAEPVTPVAPPAPPPPASPQLTTRLGQLVDQARNAHARFTNRRGNAERLVAAGGSGAPGSEGWATATIALSDLESARSDAMVALAELDEIFARESVAAAETGNETTVTAIVAARDQVAALVEQEDAVLARLRGRMRD